MTDADNIKTTPSAPPPSGGATGGSPEGFVDLKDQVRFVIIVLFVGFAVLLATVIFNVGAWYVSSLAEKQASYEDLKNQVQQVNTKMDILLQEYGKKP